MNTNVPRTRVPFIRCVEPEHSAAACLAMLGRFLGQRTRLQDAQEALRRAAGPESSARPAHPTGSAGGDDDVAITAASEALGFPCYPAQVPASSGAGSRAAAAGPLVSLRPGTVLGWFGGWHVLFLGQSRGAVHILDPAFGPRLLPRDRFAELAAGPAWIPAEDPSGPGGSASLLARLIPHPRLRWTLEWALTLLVMLTSGLTTFGVLHHLARR